MSLGCYVDDPFLSAFGDHEQRSEVFAVATLFWCALGFQLAWKKGHRGFHVPWIGALVQADNAAGTLTITLPEEKRAEALQCLADLRAQGSKIRRRDLRQATGKFEWIAGMLPQLRPFTQTLWAALSSSGASPTKVYARQVSLALTWLRAFFSLETGHLTRVVRADTPATTPVVAFDASPHGMGAVLWVVAATTEITIKHLEAQLPFAYMHLEWTARHECLAGAKLAIAQARPDGKRLPCFSHSVPGMQSSQSPPVCPSRSATPWGCSTGRRDSGQRIR